VVPKKLRFDGSICWLCPHCEAENETIKATVRVEGTTQEMNFVLDGDVDTGSDYPEFEDIYDYEEEEYLCPNCGEQVTAEDIREGFHKWLERLKDEDPEQYAQLLSEYIEPEE
jgi:ribosomal protein L37AE/L43A